MDRATAGSIAVVLRQFAKRPAQPYRVTRLRAGSPLYSFHDFADGKPLISADRIEGQGGPKLILLLIDWIENGKYLLVVFPDDRSSVLAEIRRVEQGAGAQHLVWRYRPTKQDGRNELRRSYFQRHVGDIKMSLAIPTTTADVPRFLDDIHALSRID